MKLTIYNYPIIKQCSISRLSNRFLTWFIWASPRKCSVWAFCLPHSGSKVSSRTSSNGFRILPHPPHPLLQFHPLQYISPLSIPIKAIPASFYSSFCSSSSFSCSLKPLVSGLPPVAICLFFDNNHTIKKVSEYRYRLNWSETPCREARTSSFPTWTRGCSSWSHRYLWSIPSR